MNKNNLLKSNFISFKNFYYWKTIAEDFKNSSEELLYLIEIKLIFINIFYYTYKNLIISFLMFLEIEEQIRLSLTI